MYRDGRSPLERLVGAALWLLLATVAVDVAIHLVESIAVPLIVIGASLGAVAVMVLLARRRGGGW